MAEDNVTPFFEPVRPAFLYGPTLCDALEELVKAARTVVELGNSIRQHPEVLRIERFAADHKISFRHMADTPEFKAVERALLEVDKASPVSRMGRSIDPIWTQVYGRVQMSVAEFIVFLQGTASDPLRTAYGVVEGTSLVYKGPQLSDEIVTMGNLCLIVNECIKQRFAETADYTHPFHM